MAIEKIGNKTYANIDDLPVLGSIEDADKILVQTSSGTSTIPFKNFVIPLDNLAFKTQYQELYNNYTSNEGLDEKIGYAPVNIHSDESTVDNLSDAVNQLDKNDISNYNALVADINRAIKAINDIQDIMKLNPDSFPNLPEGMSSLSEALVTLDLAQVIS